MPERLKSLIKSPEDFVVKEVANIEPKGKGSFSLFLLQKKNATTWDVLGDISKRIRKPLKDIGFGGLKDKRSVSYQYITIREGPKKDIVANNYTLSYLGQTTIPMSKDLLIGNRFEITLQNALNGIEKLKRELLLVEKFGVANYFDNQRFGSIRHHKNFCVREIIKKNYEKALYLLLVEGSHYEFVRTLPFRRCLKKFWGEFTRCMDLAPSPWERRLLAFLAKNKRSKRTFKRALGLVNREYLLMLCQTYQAYIWNEVVKLLLKSRKVEGTEVSYLAGTLYLYRILPEEFLEQAKAEKIPLPSPKLCLKAYLKDLFEKVLEEEGISDLRMFRTLVKGGVFKSYPRPLLVFPKEVSITSFNNSPHIKLSFFLPKGSYATLILKRLFFVKGSGKVASP